MLDLEEQIGHHHHFVDLGHGCNCGEGTKELAGILAKQRTLLLKEVREKVEPMACTIKRNHPKECHYPIALGDILKEIDDLL